MFTLLQNVALCIPRVRSALRIPKLLKPSFQSEEPSKFIENFKKALRNFQSKKYQEIIIHTNKPLKSLK